MTVLEKAGSRDVPVALASPSERRRRRRSYMRETRFAKYFTRSGWAHALLLLAAWMFLFPFVWMLATSVKTDEELMEPGVLPPAAHFRPDSPYVRSEIQPIKPSDVENARWNQMLPSLSQFASDAIKQYQQSHPAEPSLSAFDANQHRQSASAALVNSVVSKLDRRLWAGDDNTLATEFKNLLDEKAVATSLSDALARIELISFQLRTLDLHIFNLTKGNEFPSRWTIESGDAKLFGTGDTTRLSYHFDSSSSVPIVLRFDFHLPPGVK